MAVRGKDEVDSTQSSDRRAQDHRWPLADEEELRKQVASRLHGNVQTGLSACNVWLSMAEQLLAGAHTEAVEGMFGVVSDGEQRSPTSAGPAAGSPRPFGAAQSAPYFGVPSSAVASPTGEAQPLDERVTQRIVGALSLLYKVRGEVERLRTAEVPLAAETLYPALIHVGLRPALESLLDAMRLEYTASDEGALPADEHDEAVTLGELHAMARAISAPRASTVPTVTWLVDEPFVHWDKPSRDERLLNERLEAYRFLETVLRAAQAAYKVFYLSRAGARAHGDADDGQPPHLDVWLNVGDGCLHILVHVEGRYGPEVDDQVVGFILQALPRQRVERAGGELSVTAAIRGGLQIAASLPVS